MTAGEMELRARQSVGEHTDDDARSHTQPRPHRQEDGRGTGRDTTVDHALDQERRENGPARGRQETRGRQQPQTPGLPRAVTGAVGLQRLGRGSGAVPDPAHGSNGGQAKHGVSGVHHPPVVPVADHEVGRQRGQRRTSRYGGHPHSEGEATSVRGNHPGDE